VPRFSGVDSEVGRLRAVIVHRPGAELLITGLTAGEFRSGHGAVYQLLGTSGFILRPLPDLRVVETGFGPAAASGEQWDDAGNLLVLAPGLVVSHERNVATHARLQRIGIDVITVPGSELCGSRGGPRSLCCPVSRDPAPLPAGLSIEL
jgi:arginine deiminase